MGDLMLRQKPPQRHSNNVEKLRRKHPWPEPPSQPPGGLLFRPKMWSESTSYTYQRPMYKEPERYFLAPLYRDFMPPPPPPPNLSTNNRLLMIDTSGKCGNGTKGRCQCRSKSVDDVSKHNNNFNNKKNNECCDFMPEPMKRNKYDKYLRRRSVENLNVETRHKWDHNRKVLSHFQ